MRTLHNFLSIVLSIGLFTSCGILFVLDYQRNKEKTVQNFV